MLARVGQAEALLTDGNVSEALRLLAQALETFGAQSELLTVTSNAWVVAVDSGGILEEWTDAERDNLHTILIEQPGCTISPPVFVHRIAAQHSGGLAGHLERAAGALHARLGAMLSQEQPGINALLMSLLLRGASDDFDQARLSALHLRYFARFSPDDLRIPYSIVFDRKHFRRNVDDMALFVRTRGVELTDGSLSLIHLLFLSWLVPAAFADLPADWAARATLARKGSGNLSDQEAAAARSLALRWHFSIQDSDNRVNFDRCADDLATARTLLAREASGGSDQSIQRLEQRSSQLFNVLANAASTAVPALAGLRRRPRVALCISGQLRGFQKAWKTWKPLLAGVDATIFVDSWKRIGHGTPEPFRFVLPFEGPAFCEAYKAIGTEIGLDELRSRYPGMFATLNQSGTVEEADLQRIYGTPHVHLDDDGDQYFGALSNSEKMYLKIERCFDRAWHSGEDFDLFVRIRPDKPIEAVAFSWIDLMDALRSRPMLFCETALGVHYGAILMGDQVAIGLPEASRVYAETFRRAPPISELAPYRMESHLHGHTSVAQLCWMSGIDVRKVPIKFGPFQEAEPLSAKSIQSALAQDSAGRLDAIDKNLIAANRRDIGR